MPFFKYDSVFPYLHECPECEAQFVSVVPDISQIFKERRKTVRAKRPVQHRNADICPHCGSGVVFVKGSIIHSPCFICGRKFDPHTGKGKRSAVA